MAGKDFTINKENKTVLVLSGTTEAADVAGTEVENAGYAGGVFFLDVTNTGTGQADTLDVKLKRKDPYSGNYVDLPGGAFSQVTSTGTSNLAVYPGVAETANESVSDVLGSSFKATANVAGTAPAFTFTLGCDFVP